MSFESDTARQIKQLQKQQERMRTRESGYTMGDVIGSYMALPELRGFWPMSSVNESGNIIDLSGHGRTLTNNNTAPRAALASGLPYITLNGTTQYLSRAHEAGLVLNGTTTVGGWYNITRNGVGENLIYKSSALSNNLGWGMEHRGTNEGYFYVSGDGIAVTPVASTIALSLGWHYMIGRYTPSTELVLFVDGVKYINTTSIPASIFTSTAIFTIGVHPYTSPIGYFAGSAALNFMCAAAVPDAVINRIFNITRGFFGV